jgi:hypothetical protein
MYDQPTAVPRALPSNPKDTGRVAAPARQKLIETAAYYLAERRGFAPGSELDDWLAAEASIR